MLIKRTMMLTWNSRLYQQNCRKLYWKEKRIITVHSDKLNDPHTIAKSYWSILKTLYNWKKIPLIPPILISDKLVSNFKEKANHFNAFFASQCTPVPNNSTLPLVTTPITNASLSSISFNDQDILNVIHSLNINKAHWYDDLSIRLLKICDSTIVKPFVNNFQELFAERVFS